MKHPTVTRSVSYGLLSGVVLVAVLGTGALVGAGGRLGRKEPAAAAPTRADLTRQALAAYGRLPLAFETNQGQLDPSVRFFTRGGGYNLFLTGNEAVFALHRPLAARPGKDPARHASNPPDAAAGDSSTLTSVVRLAFAGARAGADVQGTELLPGKVHYLAGNDRSRWRTNVPRFARVNAPNLYPGVDLTYYGNQQHLEYDFVVHPGADPGQIRMSLSGANRVALDKKGNLVLATRAGKLIQQKPVIYQEVDGSRKKIAGRYVVLASAAGAKSTEVGFRVDRYNPALPLVIDPVLTYSTYLGSTNSEIDSAIAIDGSGNAYIAGISLGDDYPVMEGTFQTSLRGFGDVVVTKLNPSGTDLVYSTYLGGTGVEMRPDIAVDAQDRAYITGATTSLDFPVTEGAFSRTHHGNIETPPGGNGPAAVRPQEIAYVEPDLFVSRLDAAGANLEYSTFLGGLGSELDPAIAVDGAGRAYVSCTTDSYDFPTTPGAFDRTLGNPLPFGAARRGGLTANGGSYATSDIAVVRLNDNGSDLGYATYLGGMNTEQDSAIALDPNGHAYVACVTWSNDYPTTSGALDTARDSYSQDFGVTQLNGNGTGLVYSTYLGGRGTEARPDVAVAANGSAFVTGATGQIYKGPLDTVYPVTPGAFQTTFSGDPVYNSDVVLSRLNPAGNSLVFSTYLGKDGFNNSARVGLDTEVNPYVAFENSPILLARNPAAATGGTDVWVRKLDPTGAALLFETVVGGSGEEYLPDLAVAPQGSFFVTTQTDSADFPVTPGAFSTALSTGEFYGTDFTVSRFSELFPEVTSPPGPAAPGERLCFPARVTDEFGQPAPHAPVTFFVTGAGADNQVSMQVTDEAGNALFCYTPTVSGVAWVTVFVDSDEDGEGDPGERNTTVSLIVGTPPSTKGFVTGNGKVLANGEAAYFDFSVYTRRDGVRPSGAFTFRIPGTGLMGRAFRPNHWESLVTDRTDIPNRASIYGKLQTNQYGVVSFRADIQDFRRTSAGRDSFVITLYVDTNHDGILEALTFGGPIQLSLGLRNDITVN